jgi:hypothetical protein
MWVYRDWTRVTAPGEGDLLVFDVYTGTTDFNAMKGDQIGKFQRYTGSSAVVAATPPPPLTGGIKNARKARDLGLDDSDPGESVPRRKPLPLPAPRPAPQASRTNDLFLLSWTLTPITGVELASKEANRYLAASIRDLRVPNAAGKIINIVYVDFAQKARVTDVCLYLNGVY